MQDGQTPLHMAASGRLDGDLEGRLACIAFLLSFKANVELPDKVPYCVMPCPAVPCPIMLCSAWPCPNPTKPCCVGMYTVRKGSPAA